MKPKDAKPKTAEILQRIPHPEDPASCSTRGNPGVVLESSKSNREESLPSETVQLRHLPTQDDGSFPPRNTDDPDQATESDTQLVAVSSASSGNNLAQETLVDSMSESSGMLMRTAPDYQTPMHPKQSVPEPKVHSSTPNASTNLSENHQTEELTDDQGSMELTDDQSVQTYPEQSQQKSNSALELNGFETIANDSDKTPIDKRMTFSATNVLQPSSSFVEDHPPIYGLPINGVESRKSDSEGNASVNLGNTSLPHSGGEVGPPLKMIPGPELNFFGKPEDDAENCLDKTPSARKPNLNQTYLVCGASRSHLPLVSTISPD
ncbi:Hypothetical protein NTJ_15930 [Nesidiocoris tenuis]|uniref:Uncharacterized protein n=1 Tax=Nesidiocoris tenuis TaxID=355587 RepID=A0ABN7BI60_9HEMI|nr:Hypothetical protein NTJ_15930 [Nesidiocoris tenuis]